MSHKVLFIFPRFHIGGVSKSLSFVANVCHEHGMNVHCVSISTEPETIYLNKAIYRYTIDLHEHSKGLKRIFYRILFMIRLRYLIHKIRPNLIIVYKPDLVKALVYNTVGLHIPIIGSERGNPIEYGERSKLYKWAYNHCVATVFQTEAASNFYKLKTKSVIIPNPAFFRSNNNNESKSRDGLNIVSVGRLSEEKNFAGLIKAFNLCKDEIKDSKLIIYGDGPEFNKLQSLIKEKGLENRVFLSGYVQDFTKQDDNAGIFVLNSLTEGMPNALIEAMIAGYTCISTNCPIGGPAWLSDNGKRVRLVPINDDKNLSKALCEVVNNREEAKLLSIKAQEIKEVLHPTRIADKWISLINEILNENQRVIK